jgi:hypothetical protein
MGATQTETRSKVRWGSKTKDRLDGLNDERIGIIGSRRLARRQDISGVT